MIERYFDDAHAGGNYASAVRYGELIFVAGQLGVEIGGGEVPFDIQLRTALGHVISAVEHLGGDRTTLLKVNGYLADNSYFPLYNEVYREILGAAALPARTTVQVGGFVSPILVEVDAVAGLRSESTTTGSS